jgi:hypothetical protein
MSIHLKSYLAISFLISFCCVIDKAHAANDFTYKGQPIPALCLDSLRDDMLQSEPEKKASIELKTCYKKPGYKPQGKSADLIRKGFVGFNYTHKDSGLYTLHGSSYYKVLGKYKDSYVIYTIHSGGGSGEFTSLIVVKRQDDTLVLENTLAAGDRCNGGIEDPSLKGTTLTYKQKISPADFLDLSKDNPHKLQAYDDLAACAVCCIGSATFESDFANATFKSISLDKDAGNNNASIQGKYQPCFDKLIIKYKKQGKSKMSEEELKEFMTKFNSTCILKIADPSV